MDVDSKGFVYIGQDTVRKYDPKTGKLVGEIARVPETESGGSRRPRRGGSHPDRAAPGPAPVSSHVSGAAGARGARPEAAGQTGGQRDAFRKKYPPTTPMIVGGIEEIRIDEAANEMYVADNYLGGRVMVFALDTFAFKRGWGAYGKPLSQISTNDADRAITSRAGRWRRISAAT